MSKPLLYLLAGNGSAADWWDDALPHFQRYQVQPLAVSYTHLTLPTTPYV